MRRRRRHDAADGDPAIGGIDVQLVPDPGGGMALGVALGADIRRPSAGPPASAEGSSSVAVPAGSAPSPAPLPCVAAPACAASASLPSASAPPSPAPRSPSHPARCAPPDGYPSSAQSASHADGWPDRSRQTRKRPAKTSPRSEAGPAPLQPHSRHSLPSTSRRSIRPRVVGTVEHGLGYEGARQRRAVLLRTP